MNTTVVHQPGGYPLLIQPDRADASADDMQCSTVSPSASQMESLNGQNAAFPKLNEIRRPPASTETTRVIYHVEDQDDPIAMNVPISSDLITLHDLKTVLNLQKSRFKFYFKSFDKDVGVVKEQIFDDKAILPMFHGKVVVFIESADSANSQCPSEISNRISRPGGTIDQMHNKRMGYHSDGFHMDTCGDTSTETDSVLSSRRGGSYQSPRHRYYNCNKSNHAKYGKCNSRYHRNGNHYGDSSVVTSDMESYVDSDDDYDDEFVNNDDSDEDYDDYSSRMSSTTEETSVSRQYTRKHRNRRRYRNQNYRNANMSRTSSISSFSETSLNVIQVSLNLDVVNYLGISLVGQTSQKGDGGIYVSSIMKDGAVDLDGRIEPGDMILQVNDINFNMLTNDEAVQVIREAVKKPGPIKLLVAKCWEDKGHFTIPRSEPVRPIDPGAWVAHTEAARAKYTNHDPNFAMNGSIANYGGSLTEANRTLFQQPQVPLPTAPSFANSTNSYPLPNSTLTYPNSLVQGSPLRNSFKSGHSVTIAANPTSTVQIPPPLTIESNKRAIVCAMASPDSGLDVHDRMWLKIRIPNAFIGSDVVQWLLSYVQGLHDRKEAKKLASKLLKEGYIQHTINLKNSFSEKCYYVFDEAILNETMRTNAAESANQIITGLEEDFSNGLRLTNGNFVQDSGTLDHASFTALNQQCNLATTTANPNTALAGANNAAKPGMMPFMPFMRYWDETSEIHNYGLFGPTQQVNSDAIASMGITDGTSSNHSGGGGGANCGIDSYHSDEQMSQRSGQSVLYNPNAAQGLNATNTMASSGSNGSRHTAASNQQSTLSNGNSNANSANGNILNHHYEDLQLNPVTGGLVPSSSLRNDDVIEYQQQQYVASTFAQSYRTIENEDATKGNKQGAVSHVYLSDNADYCDPCHQVASR